MVDPLRQDERIEARAELAQRPDLRRVGLGTRLHALKRRPWRVIAATEPGANAALLHSFTEGRNVLQQAQLLSLSPAVAGPKLRRTFTYL